MNSVVLSGRLTRDAEVRYSGNDNKAVANFSLAVDRRFKHEGGQDADFINCVAFNKTAELIEKYCFKGTKLIVEGSIRTGSYTNKEGKKVYTTDVVVDNIEFAESKKSDAPAQTDNDGWMDFAEGVDLPFN